MQHRLLTDEELGNWDAWRRNNPNGPRVNPQGALDGRGGGGHPRARRAIDLRHFGRGGAFDAKARDEAGNEGPDLEQLVAQLKALKPKELTMVLKALQEAPDDQTEAGEDDEQRTEQEQQAMDSASASFERLYGVQPPRPGVTARQPMKPVAVSAEALQSFHELFPGARR